jgi:hypothetical protein
MVWPILAANDGPVKPATAPGADSRFERCIAQRKPSKTPTQLKQFSTAKYANGGRRRSVFGALLKTPFNTRYNVDNQ